jgi:hypothetical protein
MQKPQRQAAAFFLLVIPVQSGFISYYLLGASAFTASVKRSMALMSSSILASLTPPATAAAVAFAADWTAVRRQNRVKPVE